MLPFVAFLHALRELASDPTFRAVSALLGGLMLVGTIVYATVEGWTLLDSLYFCVITLATVGYGDFAPRTPIGRAFTIPFVLTGIGLLVAFASRVVNVMVADRAEQITERRGRRDRGAARPVSGEADPEAPGQGGRP